MVGRSEDEIDQYIKYMELERNIFSTVNNSELEQLEDNICHLGFFKIFESEDVKWFLYGDYRYVLALSDSELHLYEKGVEIYYNKE